MNETTTTTVTETQKAEEHRARTLAELKARTVKAAYEATEARLLMEKEETTPEEGTAVAFTNQVLSKIDRIIEYREALLYEARALKAYAYGLEFFDGASQIKLIKDLRACAADRFKTKRALKIKADALIAFIYGEKGSK